jgi:hypothetical protein
MGKLRFIPDSMVLAGLLGTRADWMAPALAGSSSFCLSNFGFARSMRASRHANPQWDDYQLKRSCELPQLS